MIEKNLTSTVEINQELEFLDDHEQKSFRKSLKKFKNSDWVYKSKKITYKFNEYGFRTKSFDNVDWSNSICVLGCSMVMGTGLALEDTLCYNLEKILNISVVNLGICASAIDYACWNSLRLHNFYPRPKAIVQLWTSKFRYTDRNHHYVPFHTGYYSKLNWNYRSELYIETDRALWKNRTIYVEASFFPETCENQKKIIPLKFLDQARDLSHPGIESNKNAATVISDELIKQGIQS